MQTEHTKTAAFEVFGILFLHHRLGEMGKKRIAFAALPEAKKRKPSPREPVEIVSNESLSPPLIAYKSELSFTDLPQVLLDGCSVALPDLVQGFNYIL